ncbi:MAG: type II secretion system F family protein [Pirellulaceae bacterium]
MTDDRTSRLIIAGRPLPLPQLVALNDEIAALVRAGIPLHEGLLAFAVDTPGRLGETALQLAERLQQGEQLEQILMTDTQTFPPVWRAVVAAGVRSGNLAVALEGLAVTGRRLDELQLAFRAALFYPLVVVVLAYALFIVTVTQFIPALSGTYRGLTGRTDEVLDRMASLGESAPYWGPLVPLLVLAAVAFGWNYGHRSLQGSSRATRRTLGDRPWRRALDDSQLAMFAELLSLLLRHQVPLADALRLAAHASGSWHVGRVGEQLAERVERGEHLTAVDARTLGFPPLLGWLISTGRHDASLVSALDTVATRFRQRAIRRVAICRTGWPLLATATVGGAAVMTQALMLWIPVGRMLYSLGAH